jgi:hypothetical protein
VAEEQVRLGKRQDFGDDELCGCAAQVACPRQGCTQPDGDDAVSIVASRRRAIADAPVPSRPEDGRQSTAAPVAQTDKSAERLKIST